jgi:hypothetical protein
MNHELPQYLLRVFDLNLNSKGRFASTKTINISITHTLLRAIEKPTGLVRFRIFYVRMLWVFYLFIEVIHVCTYEGDKAYIPTYLPNGYYVKLTTSDRALTTC